MKMRFILLFCILFIVGCKSKVENSTNQKQRSGSDKDQSSTNALDYDPEFWKEITSEHGVILDIRYSTKNNFTKNQIYPCGRCFLRPLVADKIIALQNDIKNRYDLRLKLFDCYRPRPAQQKLWDIVPDPNYVTPPDKGSMHNRGLAIDLTLVDSDGKELDMGTEYDHFGKEAHTDNTSLPKEVLKNRTILTKLMEIHGLKGIRTEWWHFSLKTKKAVLDNWEWECEEK